MTLLDCSAAREAGGGGGGGSVGDSHHQLPGATSPSKGSSLPSPEVLTSDLTQKRA